MATPVQKFIVFNYVTSSVEESEIPPNYGDPNSQVQADLSQAYTGSTSGGTSLSAAAADTPTVAQLADPSAQLVAAAQASLSISTEQLTQIQQSVSSLDLVGAIPSTISSMSSHANNILENGTSIFRAIDLTFKPSEAGSASRCDTLTGFIGSVQGAFNSTLQSVTSTLGSITSALVSIPGAIISGFTSAITGVLAAIKTGAQQLINSAIQVLSSAGSQLFGGLGSDVQGLIQGAGKAISGVQEAIQAEIDNVAAALSNVTNNLFRLTVPNVNPCLRTILSDSNSSSFEISPASSTFGSPAT